MPALVELHVRYRLQTAYAIHGDSEHSSHVDRSVERGQTVGRSSQRRRGAAACARSSRASCAD